MLQLNRLPMHQQIYLQTLANQYAELLPEAMAVHSLILMFDMLEALECTHQQIEEVFGPEVMLYLTGLLYGAQQAAAGIATPLATLPLITINGRPIPLLGTVDPTGVIHLNGDDTSHIAPRTLSRAPGMPSRVARTPSCGSDGTPTCPRSLDE